MTTSMPLQIIQKHYNIISLRNKNVKKKSLETKFVDLKLYLHFISINSVISKTIKINSETANNY